METGWQKIKETLFRYRIRLSFLVFGILVGVEFYRGVQLRSVFSTEDPIGMVASLMVVFGALLRSWSAGVIHKNDQLATTGPYALFRHPLYLGSLNIAIGLLLLINEPVNFLVLAILIILVYVPKIRHEENLLAGLYGKDWDAFKDRTGIFFPKAFPVQLRMEWRFDQWIRNREFFGLMASFIVLTLLGWLAGR